MNLRCPYCQNVMTKKSNYSGGGCAGGTVGLLVFVVGVVITLSIPVLGWVIGPLICIGALFVANGKKNKVWQCTVCSAIIPRG
jgi:hypothetical protein